MQRSISTQTINFLRSAPRGSLTPINRQPSSAMRVPSSCPAHICPCSSSHSFSSVSIDSTTYSWMLDQHNQSEGVKEGIETTLFTASVFGNNVGGINLQDA